MYYSDASWILWAAFFLVSASDYIDGVIARKAGPTTFGAFFDPLADKVLALGGFIVFGMKGYYPWLPIVIMGLREIGVSGARSILAKYKISLPARKLGKAKTFIQLLAVGFPIFPPTADLRTFNICILWIACLLSVVSGIDLFLNAQKEVQEKNIHIGDPFPTS